MPIISIIMPVYKVEKYLGKCVDSILDQTFTDYELFIVDDGSPDSCGAIADEYEKKDPRVHAIHKENGGAPSARNAGIDRAAGEYLYFPDSDDWLEADYLQKLYDKAVETEADLVISGFTMEYFENNKSQSYSVSMPEADYGDQTSVRTNLHRYFDNMMMAVPWNKLYKASYIKDKNLKFPDIKWDDLHFNMEVIRDIEKVAISDSTGYHFFRSRAGSETTTVFDKMLYKMRREQFKHILSVYKHWGVTDPEIMSVIYGYYAGRMVQCVQETVNSDVKNKRRLLMKMLNDPLTVRALKRGTINSKPLKVVALAMEKKSVNTCIFLGKMMGFVKDNMSDVYYRLKSKTVNKAT